MSRDELIPEGIPKDKEKMENLLTAYGVSFTSSLADKLIEIMQLVRADGAREFAEWIHKYLGNSNNVLYTYRQSPVGFIFVDKKSVDEILSEWQKEVNNAE